VEAIEGGSFRRAILVNGNRGYFEVSLDASRNALNVRVQIGDSRSLFFIIERIRAMFDLNADWPTIARTLGADPSLVSHINSNPGLRVPGCWNGFELATRAILEQRLGIARANELAGQIVRTFGEPFCPANGITLLFPTPGALAGANLEIVGMPRVQADAIRALSCAVRDGQISFERVADSDELLARLSEIPGIGEWTTQWVAMRALREPDAFPSADHALVRTLGLANPRELERRSLVWRPWRAYAAVYVLCFADDFRRQENALASVPKKAPTRKVAFRRQIPAVRRAS